MFKRIVSKITAAAISVSLYLPIVAGILTPMVWILVSWYSSWRLLSYIVPYSGSWAGFVYMFNHTFPEGLRIGIAVVFRFSQVLLFCFGIFLLGYGLVTLARSRVHKEGLVTYGPYRWVRHPQHLGILLMLYLLAFPLKTSFSGLFNPATRPGDLVSICSVLFLSILVADLEDYWLSKEFGDSFVQYQQDTPFILPIRLHLPESLHFRALTRGRPLRYIMAILFFWAFLLLLSYYFRLVPPPLVR